MYKIKVLMIEDDPEDAFLIKEKLSKIENVSFQIETAGTLSKGLKILDVKPFDIILLDLGLPDSSGLDTLKDVLKDVTSIPIIVLTGLENESISLKAVSMGAQDYVIKNNLKDVDLLRTIRYSLERNKILKELELGREQERRIKELHTLQNTYAIQNNMVNTMFTELTGQYEDLLDVVLNQKNEGIDFDLSGYIHDLAGALMLINVGSNDVIEIHKRSLENICNNSTSVNEKKFRELGQYMLLELISHLAESYRDYSMGNSNCGIEKSGQEQMEK